jgi:restriction endonuclease S subunit
MSVIPVAIPPRLKEPPPNWRWVKLTDVARLESGHTPSRSRSDWWGGDISWISLTEIRDLDGKWTKETRLRTNGHGIANSAARVLPIGTVCFSRTASVGFVTIMERPMATSQDFANWVCGNEVDPEFLMYALIGSRASLRDLATGATHKTIYMPTLDQFHLCMPARTEQERLVDQLKRELAECNRAVTAVHDQVFDAQQLSPAILKEMFETLISAEMVRIGDIAKTTSGSTPSRDQRAFWTPATHPWIKTGEINFAPIQASEEFVSDLAIRDCSLPILPVGTVLVAMYGQGKTRGQSAVLEIEATTNQACFAILPNQIVDPYFLQLWLRRSYTALRALSDARGGNQANLNGELLRDFRVPVSPLSDQNAFVLRARTAVSETDLLRDVISRRRKDIDLLPSRSLARAFGGIC